MSSIDAYDLGQYLGRGAFAEVFRARNRKTGLDVAIKICHRPKDEDPGWIRRMQNEISIHSKLKHPNIVSLYECFECERHVYLVLELCEGGNIYQHWRNGPLNEKLAVSIIQQLASAVDYIQDQNIMHRDLKLSNILLTGDLNDPNTTAKLCDFGLACRKEHPDEEHFTFCGTANYIAPEIVSYNAHDFPADLWSLGCLFYAMVVGDAPFEEESKEDTYKRIKAGSYEVPEGLMSPSGQHLLNSLLVSNPSRRANIKDLLAHPLLSPLTSAASSPYPDRHRHNHHRRHHHQSESGFDFSSQIVSVEQRSNPTQAGWDDVGSSSALHRSSAQYDQHVHQPPISPFLHNRMSVGRISTAASAVLQDEECSFRVPDSKLAPLLQPPPPPPKLAQSQHVHQHNKDYQAYPAQPVGQTATNVPVYPCQVSGQLTLQEQEDLLQQQLLAVKLQRSHQMQQMQQMQQAQQDRRTAEIDRSSTTMSTELVSYPHNAAKGTTTATNKQTGQRVSSGPTRQSTSAAVAAKNATQSHFVNHPAPPAAVPSQAKGTPFTENGPALSPAPAQHKSAYFPTPSPLHRPTPSDTEPTQAYRASTPKKLSPGQSDGISRTANVALGGPNIAKNGTLLATQPDAQYSANQSIARVVTPTQNTNNASSSPIGANSPNTTTNLSTSYLQGLSSLDLNMTDNTNAKKDTSSVRTSRSWLDSISEIRSSVSGISSGASTLTPNPTRATNVRTSEPPARKHQKEQTQEHAPKNIHGGAAHRETEWMRQYAYEKHINGARGLSVYHNNNYSPSSISHSLSANNITNADAQGSPLIPSDEPTLHECLDSIYRDMSTLKPFCFSSSKDELLLLSTEKELVLVLQVKKQLPEREPEMQHFRLLLSLADRSNIVLGRLNAHMVEEIEKISLDVQSAGQQSAKNQVFSGLTSEKTENYKAHDALKFHNCHSAPKLLVFSNRAGTKAIPIDTPSSNNHNDESAPRGVPVLVNMMLQRVYQLLLSTKSRIPKQVTYFTTQMSAHHDHSGVTTHVECKCMVMKNDPFPDFIVQWNDGARLKYELKTGRLQIVIQNATKKLKWSGFIPIQNTESVDGNNISSHLPMFAPYIRIAQRALAKCLKEWNTVDNSGMPKVYVLE